MGKHTEGPWVLSSPDFVRDENGGPIAGVYPCYDILMDDVDPAQIECEANARLIAAAPDTLAERDRLKEVNAELVGALEDAILLWGQMCTDFSIDSPQMNWADTAHNALAKEKVREND